MRNFYRALAFVLSLSLIGLWILFWRSVFAQSQMMPAPAGVMLPIFYCSVAAAAARAAVRDEPIVLIFAAGMSLMPVGLLLLMMPGPTRWIALVDISIVVLGVLLVRSHPGSDPESEDAAS